MRAVSVTLLLGLVEFRESAVILFPVFSVVFVVAVRRDALFEPVEDE